MSKQSGGPAFPGTYNARSDQGRGAVREYHDTGMTLRDYFAAKAMQGMLANGDWVDRMAERSGIEPDICISKAAYEVADSMLAARDA